jgi:hypothetical protein
MEDELGRVRNARLSYSRFLTLAGPDERDQARAVEQRLGELTTVRDTTAPSPEELRAQYRLAIQRDFVTVTKPAAGLPPEHIFDWPDGLRMVVSFEANGVGQEPVLMVSASCTDETSFAKSHRRWDVGDALRELSQRLRSLAGFNCPLRFGMVSPNRVFYFTGPSRTEYARLCRNYMELGASAN